MVFTGKTDLLPVAGCSKRRLAKVAGLVFACLAAAVFVTWRHVAAGPDNDRSAENYAAEIAKTYDFKFGTNPFSPSNATSATGTFIPGEMFVPAKRCGTCHTDAHA